MTAHKDSPVHGAETRLTEQLRVRLLELAVMARRSDAAGLAAISHAANELILTHNLSPAEVLAAVHFLDARVKMLTGYTPRPPGYREYTHDEVADLMQRYPRFTIECMRQYPGKKNAIDLDKVVAALNKGKIKPPSQW
jgi:hypothetical protein